MMVVAAFHTNSAIARSPAIFKTCQAVLAAHWRPIRPTQINISPIALAELRKAYSTALEEKLNRRAYFNGDAIPENIFFKGRPIQIQTFLDGGGEGSVYLGLDRGELVILKQFYSAQHMKSNFRTARLLRQRGISVLEPLETDDSSRLAIFPHIHGLDMYHVVGSQFYKNPLLSESTRLEIQEAFRTYTENILPAYQAYHPHHQPFVKSNVMLDLDRQEFIMIDPQ